MFRYCIDVQSPGGADLSFTYLSTAKLVENDATGRLTLVSDRLTLVSPGLLAGWSLAAHSSFGGSSSTERGRGTMRRFALGIALIVASLAFASSAAATTTVEKDIPFAATISGCGDTISLSGTLVGIFTEQPLAGGGFLVTFHFQPQGVSGTSSSGVPYHATGLTRETTVYVPSGGITDTFVNRFHIVGTMGAPTYYVKDTFHITITAAGEITALVENSSLECG